MRAPAHFRFPPSPTPSPTPPFLPGIERSCLRLGAFAWVLVCVPARGALRITHDYRVTEPFRSSTSKLGVTYNTIRGGGGIITPPIRVKLPNTPSLLHTTFSITEDAVDATNFSSVFRQKLKAKILPRNCAVLRK